MRLPPEYVISWQKQHQWVQLLNIGPFNLASKWKRYTPFMGSQTQLIMKVEWHTYMKIYLQILKSYWNGKKLKSMIFT